MFNHTCRTSKMRKKKKHQRSVERAKYRKRIYDHERQTIKIMYELLAQNETTVSPELSEFEAEIGRLQVSKGILGAFHESLFIFELAPSLMEIESRLKDVIIASYKNACELERLIEAGMIYSGKSRNFELKNLFDPLNSLQEKLDHFLKVAFAAPLALQLYFNHWRFLVDQKKHLIADIKEEVKTFYFKVTLKTLNSQTLLIFE